jgi:hypothetical protein
MKRIVFLLNRVMSIAAILPAYYLVERNRAEST